MTVSDQIRPVFPSVKPYVLPEVAVKLALGASVSSVPGGVSVLFENQVEELHEQDFRLAAMAAQELRNTHMLRSRSDVIAAVGEAQRIICREIFRPDTVKVLHYQVQSKGCAFYRCVLPTLAMNRRTRVSSHLSPRLTNREALNFDVLVVQVEHSPGTLQFCRALQDMKKKIVYEIDDAFDCLESWHPRYEFYRNADKQAEVRAMMGMADAVTVTTEWMRSRYAEFTRRIEVLPNAVDLANWPQTQAHGTEEFRVLWAGSASHAGDLAVAMNALKKFADWDPSVRVIFMGMVPEGLNIRPEQVRVIPFMEFEEYPNALADLQADVAMAPLADIPFNLAKSPVKVLEYWMTGYPVVASNVGPYRIIEDGKTGLLCHDDAEWLEALRSLRENPCRGRALVAAGREAVRAHDIEALVPKREEFYCTLVG